MKIGIISAMSIEMKLIKERIKIIEIKEHAGFEFIIGKFKNINVVLTTCSVGKVNAACCTQILIDNFNVTEIINTGIAGSLNKNVKICDVVISDDVTYHDVRQAQMKRNFPFKEFFIASERLKNLAIKAYEETSTNEHNCHIGRIVTGEAFVSENSLKDTIINNFSPYCVEMEGGAIGHVAEINNIPFIIIRSISDNADDDAKVNYDDFEAMASNNSAAIVLKMLEILDSEINL